MTTAGTTAPGRARIAARTLRTDRWWLQPLITFGVLLAFVIYATWAAFVNRNYFYEPYISPFYSPCLAKTCGTVAGSAGVPHLSLLGSWWRLSPAIFILVIPGAFRLTCYYYRKAYYRSFWASPPACAVAEPRKHYTGETKFPLIFQNLHRYFFLAAVVISLINSYDAIRAFQGKDGGVGVGIGTLIMLINVALLWAYTASCHSCRHIIGGRVRSFSRYPMRYKAWTLVSKLNTKHMQLAWTTLTTLLITDLYIALVSSGTITDLRIIN
jgi:hypothetical protein